MLADKNFGLSDLVRLVFCLEQGREVEASASGRVWRIFFGGRVGGEAEELKAGESDSDVFTLTKCMVGKVLTE